MSSAVADVIVAAAQSVAKVFVIGSVGFFAVKCEFLFLFGSVLLCTYTRVCLYVSLASDF